MAIPISTSTSLFQGYLPFPVENLVTPPPSKWLNFWKVREVLQLVKNFQRNCLWCLGFSSRLSNWLFSYLQLWFKQIYTLKTVLLIIQTHPHAIHEMYHYDWSKQMICLIIDNIIDKSTWTKKTVSLAYKFKNILYQKI